ncbi:hypothetical protein KOI35_21890 [Actinoplanes bogorensis]|uniref:DUF6924 domain-containing protein n=1 Tax=Paractinoplanes bogorensis TaxID=1610840 RepID=A0ABS5YRS7_9ACTN|nr:hypothetical protein [Actinoplanes bogorensis]MBU2666155.1 hypothetical protein [Actinoplanes bogorensis]
MNDVAFVIRTDFEHPREWLRLQAAIAEPQTEDGFLAHVEFVDDPVHDGLTAPGLLAMFPPESDHSFAFLADTRALTHPDQPILVVNLFDYEEERPDRGRGPHYGTTFRVVPSEMWSVQNNLSIANMDWAEFADNVDIDGVFRGFG